MHRQSERRNARFLRILSENATLKAGLQLLLPDTTSTDARLTVEDQLREIGATAGFDLLAVSDLDGPILAGVIRDGNELIGLAQSGVRPPKHSYFIHGSAIYQVTSVPIDQGEEKIAVLSVGERFSLSELQIPAVLMHAGELVDSSLGAGPAKELESALMRCDRNVECEIRAGSQTYLSLVVNTISLGDGYVLRSLQNLDLAVAPVQSVLRMIFVLAGAGALVAALIVTALLSRSVVRPIAQVIAHLRESERTGMLAQFAADDKTVDEIRELTDSFNRAGLAIREGRESVHRAYVECVRSLATALEARDRYTAGHSHRVSDFACAVAQRMGFNERNLDELRIGALLHDIGKIGVADHILGKPGRLSDEEFAAIKRHPAIGRGILEGVNGFAPYLDTVELHHENWDGTGYPHGLRGEQTPLPARIVHVADAYDAMTSDRPYRSGMSSDDAIRILNANAGTQFDPAIVQVFTALIQAGEIRSEREAVDNQSLINMAEVTAASVNNVAVNR
jgi:HD-GYP domain-containing protein (c-di-GMP phosphodiesterase class II)